MVALCQSSAWLESHCDHCTGWCQLSWGGVVVPGALKPSRRVGSCGALCR